MDIGWYLKSNYTKGEKTVIAVLAILVVVHLFFLIRGIVSCEAESVFEIIVPKDIPSGLVYEMRPLDTHRMCFIYNEKDQYRIVIKEKK